MSSLKAVHIHLTHLHPFSTASSQTPPSKRPASVSKSSSPSQSQTSQASLVTHSLLGVTLPPKATLYQGLQEVYGIGPTRATAILRELGLSPYTLCGQRFRTQVADLAQTISSLGYLVGTDLRRHEANILGRYVALNTTKAIRMRMGYPVRGQRTATNGKTARKLNASRIQRGSSGFNQ